MGAILYNEGLPWLNPHYLTGFKVDLRVRLGVAYVLVR